MASKSSTFVRKATAVVFDGSEDAGVADAKEAFGTALEELCAIPAEEVGQRIELARIAVNRAKFREWREFDAQQVEGPREGIDSWRERIARHKSEYRIAKELLPHLESILRRLEELPPEFVELVGMLSDGQRLAESTAALLSDSGGWATERPATAWLDRPTELPLSFSLSVAGLSEIRDCLDCIASAPHSNDGERPAEAGQTAIISHFLSLIAAGSAVQLVAEPAGAGVYEPFVGISPGSSDFAKVERQLRRDFTGDAKELIPAFLLVRADAAETSRSQDAVRKRIARWRRQPAFERTEAMPRHSWETGGTRTLLREACEAWSRREAAPLFPSTSDVLGGSEPPPSRALSRLRRRYGVVWVDGEAFKY